MSSNFTKQTAPTDTLLNDIRCFAETLPEFGKFLASKLLIGERISEDDYNTAYNYFKEEFELKEKNTSSPIKIDCLEDDNNTFKKDLFLSRLDNVEGVNALVSNQVLEFHSNLTIIYGVNGSGKSGYVRLLKNAFFSRAKEEISPNIYQEEANKQIKANMYFSSGNHTYHLVYPNDKNRTEFLQFSVFDKKCAITHLDGKNQYEFKPAGLLFFSSLIDAYKKVEQLLHAEIFQKNQSENFAAYFDGESEINGICQILSANTNIQLLRRYLPYTKEDAKKKEELIKQKAVLLTQNTEKEIQKVKELLTQFGRLRTTLINVNRFFEQSSMDKIDLAILDYKTKEDISKKEGIQSFRAIVHYDINNTHWSDFIEAAERFATSQNEDYPSEGDPCILCQQPLTIEATQLIHKYWAYLKSEAEKNFKTAADYVGKIKEAYTDFNLNFLTSDSVCYQWLKDQKPEILGGIDVQIEELKSLRSNLVNDLTTYSNSQRRAIQIDTSGIDLLLQSFEEKIESLAKNNNKKEIHEVNIEIQKLNHREKLQELFPQIENYLERLKWASNAVAKKNKLVTNKITLKEKELSKKYFHEEYITTFEEECKKLNGNFGISISHTGSLGSSFRQLNILSHNPSKILSEGEQKVISIADFLAEAKHSKVNRGILFDDPVTSLDDERKSHIAERLVKESTVRQVIIFTHDLMFVSSLISVCNDLKIEFDCHWIEKQDNRPGYIHLRNTPSYEKEYKTTKIAREYYNQAKTSGPEMREEKLRNGFAALRTSYEALVVFEFFGGVIQRFNERVSIDSMRSITFDNEIKDEIIDSFEQCCRYMEGHLHSDKYSYQKPSIENLIGEIERFDLLKKKIRASNSKTTA
jgi:recombinational DNA repair ATPase RecF